MLKKKGAIQYVAALIIGGIIVLATANLLFHGRIFNAVKDLWSYTIYGQKEFVPYEEQYATDEDIVDKSVRALIFAAEKVANPANTNPIPAGIADCIELEKQKPKTDKICCYTATVMPGPRTIPNYDIMTLEDCNKKGGDKVDPSPEHCSDIYVSKQTLCIDCKNPQLKCEVKGFELPQQFRVGYSVLDWAKWWIHGAKDPKYLVFYE